MPPSSTTVQSSDRSIAPSVRLFYDGQCPLCSKEARLLERLGAGQGRLALIDITAPTFDPTPIGKTHDKLMAQIHAQLPDGTIVVGMEAFRRAYAAIGRGWLIAWTGWPIIKPITDMWYRWFAKRRMRIGSLFGKRCEHGVCGVPYSQRHEGR